MKQLKQIIIFLLLTSLKLSAQSDPKLSSYFFTPLIYNPAYAGSYEGMSFSSVYSSQWVGFEGAPNTFFFSGHGTFINSKIGLGIDVTNDKIGASNETKIMGNFAYRIELNEKWKLAMGIKSGFSNYTIDYRLLTIEDPSEFNGGPNAVNNINFNFGTGVYLYTNKYFLGISVPNIFPNTLVDSYKSTLANSSQNYFFTTGYLLELDDDVYLQPTLMSRVVKGAPLSVLYGVNLNWKEKFYASANFEFDVSIGFFTGYRFMEKYMVGYSYDISVNKFSNYNGGTHSFFLNYRLQDFWKRERCSCNTY